MRVEHASWIACVALLVSSPGCAQLEVHAAADWSAPRVTPPEPGSSAPFFLSQTGLYRDIANKVLAPDLLAYTPRYELWSDGADKQRWLRLPADARVDSQDVDHWQFPVGTQLFKEFARDGRRLETRLIMRTGPGARDYFMGAFVWDDAESDARFAPDGELDVRGTEHDVPRTKLCFTCHDGEAGRVLGFSALQLTAAALALLSAPPDAPYHVPGDALAQQALGYLHANCGSCHNQHGTAWPDTDLTLRLYASETRVEDTSLYRSTLGVKTASARLPGVRIERGNPAASRVYTRMASREPMVTMPPLGTELVDEPGLTAVGTWIATLAP